MESGRASEAYTRPEIRRILGIRENSLRSWERAGLAEAKTSYSFADLISLKTLKSLRSARIPTRKIRDAMQQLRLRLANVSSPLDELKIVSDGRRIAVELPGERMEALTGQMLFDFDAKSLKSAATLEFGRHGPTELSDKDQCDSWFRLAREMEESGVAPGEIIDVYRKVVDLNPLAAGAWVNMGSLHYRQHLLGMAEHCYNQALKAYPEYALAHFNLGNVFEDTDRLDEASQHYRNALRLKPDYGDAHFNLALVEERRERFPEAIEHWQNYLELDSSSTWAIIARRNCERLIQSGGNREGNVGRPPAPPVRPTRDS